MTLPDVLSRGRDLGFLGPGSVEDHLAHAEGFLVPLVDELGGAGSAWDGRLVDLGTGGGVPGLALALALPNAEVVLVEVGQRRAAFLIDALEDLDLAPRVRVVEARAEVAGREPGLRGGAEVVTARSFASPAVTAECASPLLKVGGLLVVSEPPTSSSSDGRWPVDRLDELGLSPTRVWTQPFHYQGMRQIRPCPDRFPRRVGVPAKRPLF